MLIFSADVDDSNKIRYDGASILLWLVPKGLTATIIDKNDTKIPVIANNNNRRTTLLLSLIPVMV